METRWDEWNRAPTSLELTDDAIDIWRLTHTQAPRIADRLFEVLTDAERDKAERFVIDRPRVAFVTTRAALRCLLASYLSTGERPLEASDIGLTTRRHGKPQIESASRGASASTLDFNVSHAGGASLLAFSQNRPVGVDLEDARRDPSHFENVARYFAAEEHTALKARDGAEHRRAFFRCWTRKEAYLKATGLGMSVELDAFAVSLNPEKPEVIRTVPNDDNTWHLRDLGAGRGFAAAVCVGGPTPPSLRTRQVTEALFERLLRRER